MRYAVLTKGVPDFRHGKVVFKEDNTLNRAATPTVMNPNDYLALEAALEAKVKYGGEIVVICMGPPPYKRILKEAMERCADGLYLLTDTKFAAADTLATAEALSAAIKKIGGVDIIFAGFKTADGETGQTGPQTAWMLDYAIASHVIRFNADSTARRFQASRLAHHEIQHVEGPLPAFIVTDPAFRQEFRSAKELLLLKDLKEAAAERAKNYERHLTLWDAAALGVNEWKVGIKGSPTIVESVDPIPRAPSERKAKILSGKNLQHVKEVVEFMTQ